MGEATKAAHQRHLQAGLCLSTFTPQFKTEMLPQRLVCYLRTASLDSFRPELPQILKEDEAQSFPGLQA